MEVVLLIIIILILFLKLNAINNKLEFLQSNFDDLKESLKKLANQKTEPIVTNKPGLQLKDFKNEVIAEPEKKPLLR